MYMYVVVYAVVNYKSIICIKDNNETPFLSSIPSTCIFLYSSSTIIYTIIASILQTVKVPHPRRTGLREKIPLPNTIIDEWNLVPQPKPQPRTTPGK